MGFTRLLPAPAGMNPGARRLGPGAGTAPRTNGVAPGQDPPTNTDWSVPVG
ncbi:hypothetical protein J7E98_08840 [Streptomyces sp. ISL-86]|nr:hypothetical protein [Streptomyces sp. ISL-86]